MNSRRRFVSLLTALSFLVLAVSGVLAFFRPFSIQIIGLHSLTGFVFVILIALHVVNNRGHLKRYVRSKAFWITCTIVVGLTALFLWQPKPVKAILGLSQNLGPAMERFEMSDDGLVCNYQPASHYRMELRVKGGKGFDLDKLPPVAIWLENASFYHIKTLREPSEGERAALPYWDFKYRGWKEAEAGKDVDAVSEPTLNSSFDPADYVLPADPDKPMPYRLLIEIDQPDDGKPSLVYAVEIDNAAPQTFQLLELRGYPKKEDDDESGKETWALYFIDDSFGSVLELVDSALLTIDRD